MKRLEDKIVVGLAPVADAFAGTKTTTGVLMRNYKRMNIVVSKGVGTTGTSTLTVEKCTAADGTGAEGMPFHYRRILANGTHGAWTRAAAAGFTTTAGSADTYEIAVDQQEEGLAEGDKPYVRLKAVEVADDPVVGAVVKILSGARYGGDTPAA